MIFQPLLVRESNVSDEGFTIADAPAAMHSSSSELSLRGRMQPMITGCLSLTALDTNSGIF